MESDINKNSVLTAEQAADVIRYYNDGENRKTRERGQKDKIPLGQSAIHATQSLNSILPGHKPLLTPREMGAGLELINEKKRSLEVESTEETKAPEEEKSEPIVHEQTSNYDEDFFAWLGTPQGERVFNSNDQKYPTNNDAMAGTYSDYLKLNGTKE